MLQPTIEKQILEHILSEYGYDYLIIYRDHCRLHFTLMCENQLLVFLIVSKITTTLYCLSNQLERQYLIIIATVKIVNYMTNWEAY